jgi:hypothetical protein
MNDKFDPASPNAMFATILAELKTLNEKADRIEVQANKTNGRVTVLEQEKWTTRGVVATIAVLAAPAWEWAKTRL